MVWSCFWFWSCVGFGLGLAWSSLVWYWSVLGFCLGLAWCWPWSGLGFGLGLVLVLVQPQPCVKKIVLSRRPGIHFAGDGAVALSKMSLSPMPRANCVGLVLCGSQKYCSRRGPVLTFLKIVLSPRRRVHFQHHSPAKMARHSAPLSRL